MYTFIEKSIQVAKEELRCDAISAYWEPLVECHPTGKVKLKGKNDIMPIASNRTGVIKKGESYIEYLFKDEEGVVLPLNVSKHMDAVMKRNNLFPDYITKQIL